MTSHAETGSDAERRAQGVVELVVPELDSALSFYTASGFAVERCNAGFAVLHGYGVRLFLARDATSTMPAVRGCNLRIVVDDVDAVYRRLTQAGLPISREPDDRSYGLRDFCVDDPNGFVLRFAQVIDA
jgi:catechol 2,3-dioxygenase-like lactoylglutathione lyase family enzyme